MKIDQTNFPFLKWIKQNKISYQDMSPDYYLSGNGNEETKEIFGHDKLSMNYVSNTIHSNLLDGSLFDKTKSLRRELTATKGVLLFPKQIQISKEASDKLDDWFKEAEGQEVHLSNFGICGVLYKIERQDLTEPEWEEDDKKVMEEAEGDLYPNELTVYPIIGDQIADYHDEITTILSNEKHDNYFPYSFLELFEYVWNFLVFYNYTECDEKIIYGTDTGKQRRLHISDEKLINESSNNIEVIDENYFTKLIRVNGFGVRGHFRVQPFGKNLSDRKIIFIEPFEKSGYTREAKVKLHHA